MIGKISLTNTIDQKLVNLKKNFPEVSDYVLASVAEETKKLIENDYMSGQVLNSAGDGHNPFYRKNKPGQWKITGPLFNLFETGKRVVSNLSGTPIDTGLIDKRPILKPASEQMNGRVDSILNKVLKEQKDLKEVLK